MSNMVIFNGMKHDFTEAEKIIVEYIMQNYNEVCNMTTYEIANATGTSPATLVRLAKKIGYSGFKALQIAIAKDTSKENINTENLYEAISVNDSTEEIISKIAMGNMDAIKNTAAIIKPHLIEKTVKEILKAKCIHLFGIGSSYIVALDFQYKLVRINMLTSLHSDYHLQLVAAANIDKNDVAIAISNSGKTQEVYNALKLCRERGATTISITRLGRNPVSAISDININTIEVEQHLRVGAISSRIAQLTIIDILFMCLMKARYHTIPDYVRETGHIISSLKFK
ncbi:MAG: MurR/RpiR family transcriptional regulator [Thermotaleaceae bacterium]